MIEKPENRMTTVLATLHPAIIFLVFGFIPLSYAQTITNTTAIGLTVNPLVYHLSSSDPWRASIAVSDANAMKDLGHNVTLLLSIEGVQLEVQKPHHHLGLQLGTKC